MKQGIKAIFLDLGGTFRVVDEETVPLSRKRASASRSCAAPIWIPTRSMIS